jgi:predicted nucleotidyltransferase
MSPTTPETPSFLRRLAAAVARGCTADEVLVFGSFAKGSWHRSSDIDLIVVLDSDVLPRHQLAAAVAAGCVPMRVDVLLTTRERMRVAQGDPYGFAGSALRHARSVWLRPGGESVLAVVEPTP